MNDTLDRAAAKQLPRRFSGASITGFGELLPSDSLVARLERIWRMRPTVIEVSIGTSNDPYCSKPTEWAKTQMTRIQAAKTLREARKEGLLIEQDRTGYVISGGFR